MQRNLAANRQIAKAKKQTSTGSTKGNRTTFDKFMFLVGVSSLLSIIALSLWVFNFYSIQPPEQVHQVPKIDNQATEAIVKKPKTESSVAKPIGPLYKASDQASYHIIGKYPRAQGKLFFTQGLSFVNSTTLLESSGLNGQSQIHYINNFDQKNSTISNAFKLDRQYFGEGSDTVTTANGQEAFMLTWRDGAVFVFDKELKKIVRQHKLPISIKEGWGITHFHDQSTDRDILLISDGTNSIFHVECDNFTVIKEVKVNNQGMPLNQLNELEFYRQDIILANVWNTNQIAKINYTDGSLIDLFGFQDVLDNLQSEQKYKNYVDPRQTGYVLNGIAVEQSTGRVIIGGKKWPYWYEIQIID